MTSAPSIDSFRLDQKAGGGQSGRVEDEPAEGAADDRGRDLVCAACGHAITTTASRIRVDGRHDHTYSNPHGYAYHFGCFAAAPGCVAYGDPESYWSWFPGYSWTLERCRACRRHLGWLFRTRDHHFHGLILDRLREAGGGD